MASSSAVASSSAAASPAVASLVAVAACTRRIATEVAAEYCRVACCPAGTHSAAAGTHSAVAGTHYPAGVLGRRKLCRRHLA